MTDAPEPLGTLEVALAHAARLLEKDPSLAAEQVREILRAVPGHPQARLILGASHRVAGRTHEALEVLEPLAREQPRAAAVLLELGVARAEAEDSAGAIAALQRATELKPDSVDGWRYLADELDVIGDAAAADQARARYLKAATRDPRLLEAAAALVANELPSADARLRAHLALHPTDVAALRMLAEVAARVRRFAEAQRLLERCLELAPGFDAARQNYATLLNRTGRSEAALREIERLLAKAPRDWSYRNQRAAILANLGNYRATIAIYEELLREQPRQPKMWMSYGHSLRTDGRQADSVAAYRRAIALTPTLGEAYWSLANLKTFRFTSEEAHAMRRAVLAADLPDEDRWHFEFALGKMLEDEGSHAESFSHYERGNALRLKAQPHDADEHSAFVQRSKSLFSGEFFAAHAGSGSQARDPIFIVGLPRAGSTLLEQILASHSQVEGTMELPTIPQMVNELHARGREEHKGFPGVLTELSEAELQALGERYLTATRVQRKTAAPLFIDKNPNNCLYVGLIHLILPNAKIIDARRHPLACGFSCFKQHFARGQTFTYSLEHLGRYYRDYVDLMAHFDQVLPNRIHRVFYEQMVSDTEAQVRALLEYCELPFEEACLRFYETERAVRTASSEQVRQPIFREGLDQWKYYGEWLTPLVDALGPALSDYPKLPG